MGNPKKKKKTKNIIWKSNPVEARSGSNQKPKIVVAC